MNKARAATSHQKQSDTGVIGRMLFELAELNLCTITFRNKPWNVAIKPMTVYDNERIVFRFKDGKDITELL